ncbi:MAG TPA: transposase [Candidatus Cloacimonadota bacterium]|nr:transposase [Candidatus Cloacimonadota bacterium]
MRTRKNSLRLNNFDYSSPGMYFITVCAQNRMEIFGEINNEKMILNDFGLIVQKYIRNISSERIRIEEFILMPNHVHILISIIAGAVHEPPLQRRQMLIPKIIGKFKMQSAKEINIIRKTPGMRVWQRGYHDHIVRNMDDCIKIKRYILDNPGNWFKDKNFSEM